MFVEGRYDAERLHRHRLAVAVLTVGGVAATLLGGALTDWPWSNALGTAAVVLAFGACLWWLFASRKAGPIGVAPDSLSRLKRTFWIR